MKILIIGTGYVGLVTGTCFAKVGHNVLCLDIDKEKINTLNSGGVPIYEPELKELIFQNVQNNRLAFTSSYQGATKDVDLCFLCVPTPSGADGHADLSMLKQAAEKIAEQMCSFLVIVIKSTVPPTTYLSVKTWISNKLKSLGKNLSFELVSNPEFLREGCAVYDCLHPDRVIIGHESDYAKSIMEKLYAPFEFSSQALICMDPTSAEMTKYAANSMLALRISFMNELSGLCEKLDANIENIRIGIGSDKRIGMQFLHAGVGFGGSCFPKDIQALRATAIENNCDTPILDAIETINQKQKALLARKINQYFKNKGGVEGKTIAIWGLSFKPNTDDIREAPAIALIKQLKDLGAKLKLYDPVAMNNAKKELPEDEKVQWCQNEYEASLGADAVALVTEWSQFKTTDLGKVLEEMKGNALFDGRNQYTKMNMNQKGFNYFGVGITSNNDNET